jgi:hypothetical protein
VTVTNTGNATLNIATPTVSGVDSTDFAVIANGCAALAPGGACDIGVTFTPGAAGPRSAQLSVPSDAPSSPQTVTLDGIGLAPPRVPAVSISPATVAYAGQVVGTTSAPAAVTITNTGTAPLTVGTAQVTGAEAADFQMVADTCGVVAVAASCTITESFVPAATGTRTAQLTITSDAPGSPDTVPLSGTGLPLPPPPPTAPTAPAIVTVSAANRVATAGWTAPASNGGAAVTAFQLRAVAAASTVTGAPLTPGTVRTGAVTGLANGTSYRLEVRAENAAGWGPWSAPSLAVVPATVPGAPRIGAASSGSTTDARVTATARWLAPSLTGGAPIKAYQVTAVRSTGVRTTLTVGPAARSLSFTGLVRNARYRFVVTAVNRRGAGPSSAASGQVVAR